MQRLPIDLVLPDILAALRTHGAAVVVAEPGAGKTTRVPPAILSSGILGDAALVMLEPRRVAARAAARRIAAEIGEEVGESVGFQVRFERKGNARTRLWVLTEGVMTRRFQDDPFLDGTGCIVLDEFHERSIDADLALALAADIRREVRPDLKIVVMSATIDPEPVAAFLGGVPIVRAKGRAFPVTLEFLDKPDARRVPELMAQAIERHAPKAGGDVLAFLPGAGEIQRTAELLDQYARVAAVDVLPLHGDLPPEAQDRAIEPGPMRKIILATNVAETSLTIEGVTLVVDSGFMKQVRHDPRLGIDRLELKRISRASADQRSGRAGRTGPGKCVRLWTLGQDKGLDDADLPEIRRVDLAQTVLELAAWGVADPASFRWFEAPLAADLERATALLMRLGAIESASRTVTDVGRAMLRLPLHPRLARLIVEARRRGVVRDAAVLAAICSEKDIVLGHRAFGPGVALARENGPSDLLWRLDLYREAERGGFRSGVLAQLELDGRSCRSVQRIAAQIERAADDRSARREQGGDLETDLLKTVLAGFPDRVARRRAPKSPKALMIGGRGLSISERSVLRDDEFFVAVLAEGGRAGALSESQVRWASRVEVKWLEELWPGSVRRERGARFDAASERVQGVERRLFGDLLVEEKLGFEVDPAEAEAALAAACRADPRNALPRTEEFREFCVRWRCIAEWRPELGLPALDDQALGEAAAAACAGKRTLAEVRNGPIAEVLLGGLDRRQRHVLENEMPLRLSLPSGKSARVRYEVGRPPVISARVQDFFGLTDTPTIAGGKVACVVEILAPNYRPVQVTQDLRSFWKNTYQQVRKDLRNRYPKHNWPEKPPGMGES